MTRLARTWIGSVVAMAIVVGVTSVTFAFQGQTGFVPADTLNQESVPGGWLAVAAYSVAWIAVVGYVFALWRRAGRIERELADVLVKASAARR